jgi:hypothetical protein
LLRIVLFPAFAKDVFHQPSALGLLYTLVQRDLVRETSVPERQPR